MAEFDAQSLAEQAVMIGLLSREQVRESISTSEDGSLRAISRTMLRKGYLTSWQRDKLLKGDMNGFFFGGCKVLFHLAEGTFARVYRGIREQSGQSVAIKVLRRRFTTDAAAVERFNQEAESGLKLVHPNIVRITDFGEQDKNYYMIMEYVEGSNLRDFLKIRQRLSVEEALPMMVGLSQGLQFSLDKGVTHRDIKASNILIGSKGEAKLVDFGLATIDLDDFSAGEAHGVRTVDYSALERTCGTYKGDPRSDIYFLGCVYYQMLTGTAAMPETETSDQLSKMLKRSFGAIKPLREHRSAPPEGLARIIEKMMKVDLKARYQNMDEVVNELLAYQHEGSTEGLAAATAAIVRKSKKKKHNVGGMMTGDDLFAAAFGDLDGDDEDEDETVPEPEPVAAAAAAILNPPDNEDYDPEFILGVAEPEEPAAPSVKQVLCVEFQEAIQTAFRKVFAQMGYEVELVSDAVLAARHCRKNPVDALVFDADGLGPGDFTAFLDIVEEAHEKGRELAALVLLGPKQGAFADRLPGVGRIVVLHKPLKMKEIQDAMKNLVPVAVSG